MVRHRAGPLTATDGARKSASNRSAGPANVGEDSFAAGWPPDPKSSGPDFASQRHAGPRRADDAPTRRASDQGREGSKNPMGAAGVERPGQATRDEPARAVTPPRTEPERATRADRPRCPGGGHSHEWSRPHIGTRFREDASVGRTREGQGGAGPRNRRPKRRGGTSRNLATPARVASAASVEGKQPARRNRRWPPSIPSPRAIPKPRRPENGHHRISGERTPPPPTSGQSVHHAPAPTMARPPNGNCPARRPSADDGDALQGRGSSQCPPHTVRPRAASIPRRNAISPDAPPTGQATGLDPFLRGSDGRGRSCRLRVVSCELRVVSCAV